MTYFYVAERYTGGTKNGGESTPWNNWAGINWTTISTALSSDNVTIYFDSRGDWSAQSSVAVGASGSASYLLSLLGDAKYCTGTSTVTWYTESSPGIGNTGNRALFGDTIYTGSNRAYVTIKGFEVDTPSYTGVGDNGGSTEVNTHITVDNIYVVGPTGASQPGINFSRLSTGSHDIVIRYCYISQSTAEGIYVGHSSEMDNYLTGVIVEYNTIVDCGTSGEGDIDIKPNVEAPIIRYNTHYDTTLANSSCGVACYADKAEIYGNKFYSLKTKGSEWGWGIMLTNYGSDGGTRKIITSCRIYNNLIYSNELDGIKIDATGASANMTGIKINSNVIASNARYGISTAVVSTITIAEMKNNIFYSNVNYDVQFVSGVTITSANNNCWYRPSGNSWYYQGAAHTWAEWQGHGFDAAGVNSDPLFTNPGSGVYTLQAGSPGLNTGATLGSPFNIDILEVSRPQGAAYDMGAYEAATGGGIKLVMVLR
jgi:hypothetical protein